ncbi:hypothetical protein CXF85_10175 [Colwellia sp. 75C3]|uniref:hypothetical protein n=1 Tax=Colwellia sp. 75C3 TaxID=888425 RepID=UPI000C328D62|nr:hypothetical protein [Colwellia sp. 75C3]PKG83855.1 hypothetical protein CXF85_10175 [Colwellia sp. 75C3]
MFSKMTTYLIVVAYALFLSGCASNVYFLDAASKNDELKNNNATSGNTVKLYIDAFGNLYPDNGYQTNQINEDLSGSLYDQSTAGNLCSSSNRALTGDAKLLCKTVVNETCDVKNKPCFPNEQWLSAQTQLWKNAGTKIYSYASNNKAKRIFFLIHGFNNTVKDSAPMYELVKKEVTTLTGEENKPLFVEIYWDGFEGLPLSGAWSSAQSSGPLVGFNLRQLFKGVQTAYANNNVELPNVSVFTHSSGAFIIGATLGDPYGALPDLKDPKSPEYAHFKKLRNGQNKTHPIPNFPQFRVGMIAAATPSETFTHFNENPTGEETGILSNNTSLIFSINENDFALNKGFGLQNVNALGASGAGADLALYCDELAYLKDGQVESYAFNFAHPKSWFLDLWDEHNVKSYLSHDNKKVFLQSLLGMDFTYKNLCSNKS